MITDVKRIAGKLCLSLFAFLLVMGGTEIALRLLYPVSSGADFSGITVPDDALGYRFVPNSSKVIRGTLNDYSTKIHISPYGFRSPAVPVEKPDGLTVRLVLFGDSEVFGCGVATDDMLNVRLEELLNSSSPQMYQALNFGMPGIAAIEQEVILNDLLPQWRPDILVSVITVANDLSDTVRSANRSGSRKLPTPAQGSARFWHRSELYHLLKLTMLPRLPRFLTPRSHWVREAPPFVKQWFLDENMSATFDVMTSALSRVKKKCDDHGVAMILVAIPSRCQFDPTFIDILSRTTERELLESVLSDWDRPQRMLSYVAEREGITYVPVLPTFRELAADHRMRLKHRHDGHLNALGTLELARLISKAVQSEQMAEANSSTVTAKVF